MKNLLTFFILLIISSTAHSQVWEQHLNGRNVWSLARDSQGYLYAGGLTNANSRIWRSTNEGSSWDTIYIGTGSTMWGIDFDSLGNIYVANFTAGLLKSTNGGTSFTTLDTSNFNGKRPQGVACGINGYIYVTTASGFFRSTDFGSTFTETALTGLNSLPVIVDIDSSNIVYVGISSASGTGIGFYRSTNHGATFSVNLNPNKNGYNIHQKSDGTVYMITTTSPYNVDKSTDRGLSWTTQGNASAPPRGITTDLAGNIYLAGNGGVYKSTNGGASFSNFNLTGSCTPIMAFGNKIIAGAIGGGNAGVYIYTDSTLVGIEPVSNTVPGKYALYQNYPNPFNPSTTIRFALPQASVIKLTVYDISGREIKVLLDEFKNAGTYSLNLNAETLSSGIYLYKLEAGKFSQIRKMILVR